MTNSDRYNELADKTLYDILLESGNVPTTKSAHRAARSVVEHYREMNAILMERVKELESVS